MLVARNALRPFFNARKDIRRAAQFQVVRQSAPLDRLDELYAITEGNRAYRFPGLGNTFPRDSVRVPDSTLLKLTPLPLAKEVALHVGRLNYHAPALIVALNALANVNDAIRRGDWAGAEEAADRLRDSHGLSIAGMRKELLVAFQLHGLAGLSRRYTKMADSAERRAWALLAHIAYDFMDAAFSPERAARTWLTAMRDRSSVSHYYVSLAVSELIGCWPTRRSLADALLRYGCTSLVDLALCLWKAMAIRPEWPEIAGAYDRLDAGLLAVLTGRFSAPVVVVPGRYLVERGAPTDVDVFRATFFFQEDAPVARWRAAFMPMLYPEWAGASVGVIPAADGRLRTSLISDGEEGEADARPGIDGLDAGLTQPVVPAGAAEGWPDKARAAGDATDPTAAIFTGLIVEGGAVSSFRFVTSVIVADLLRSLDSTDDLVPKQLVKLLAASSNIHEYVDGKTLAKLLAMPQVAEDRLLVFLLRDMLFRRHRSQDDELDRRAAFMDMFSVGGRAEIVPFLDDLARWSRATARHVARLCTRSFLERLYLLVSSVQEVVETRIAICDWLLANSTRGHETIREERDALERELANLAARSDLDSTRVHVDEDSLREWYGETQNSKDRRYKQTVLAEGADAAHGVFLDFYNKTRERPKGAVEGEDLLADTQIGSEFILLSVFESTLRAFVTDKTFGLDSYLSRRIRHGTLRGFLTTPLARVRRKLADDIVNEERATERAELEAVAASMDRWLDLLAGQLDHLRREVIQIRSDRHSGGLIEASWRTPTNVRHLDAMMARIRARVIESRGGYDMFSDVYLLCWDCLERDLAHVRVYLNRDFYRQMASELTHLYAELTLDQRVLATRYWNDLHTILNGRIQEVCGWFIRPVFRRDAYDLRTLAESTISIVRELDDAYSFDDRVDIEGVSINRGSFDVVGDILFALIGNAAKHGKSGGLVEVGAEMVPGPEPLISLSVTSEVASIEALETAAARMRQAADSRDLASIHSAGVIEGFSGIRKVIGLLSRVKATTDLSLRFDPDALQVGCRVLVPPTISFARERT